MDTARARADAASRRDAALEAIAFAAQRFLESPTWGAIVPEVLHRLGEAMSVSRVYVFERTQAAGGSRVTQLYEWVAPDVAAVQGEPYVTDRSLASLGLGRWEGILERGDVVHGVVATLPDDERPVLQQQQIRSILVVPIDAGATWWGFIGFDDCVDERGWTQIEIDALRAAAGTIGAAIHRQRTETQLAEAERTYRVLVEQIPAVTYRETLDGDPEGFYISPQVRRFFGYEPDEWRWTLGFWADRIHPEDRARVLDLDERSNRTREPLSMEYRFRTADGAYRWIRDEATLVRGEDGPSFWQGILLDVTERREAEELLANALEVEREAGQRLRALDEMKNTFLQAVSHDLRTPLAAILGLALTLGRRDVRLDTDEARDLARRIAANARRLDRLVVDLLDLDRLARGVFEPKPHPTDLGTLVRRIVSETDLLADGRVRVDAPSLLLNVDAAKVERIVENLLANAARHTPAGTRVWVHVEPAEGGALVAVDDEGPGVPEEVREEIFEPFRQGPAAPSHAPGVGVGLALVARFAELLGGRAWVEPRAGGGASFRVFLADAPLDAEPR